MNTSNHLTLPLIAEEQITIQQPRAKLFKWLIDFENNYPQFFPGVIEMTALDALPLGTVGKRYQETVDVGFKKETLAFSITKIVENQEIQLEPELEILRPTFQFLFLATEPQVTQFHWRCYSRLTDSSKLAAAKNTIGKLLAERAVLALKNLKSLTEKEIV